MRLLWRQISLSLVFVPVAAGASAANGGRPFPSTVQLPVTERAHSFELRLAQARPAKGLTAATLPYGDGKIFLHPTAIVTHRDVTGARAVRGQFAPAFSVEVTFSSQGSKKLTRATKGRVGWRLAILINGGVVSAPVLTSAISDTVVITGTFRQVDAQGLAADLVDLAKKTRAD